MLRGRPYDYSYLKVKKQPKRRGQVACSQAACEWWSSGAMAAQAEGEKWWHRLSRAKTAFPKPKSPGKEGRKLSSPWAPPGPPLTSAFPIHPKIQGMLDQVRCCEGPRRHQEVHARARGRSWGPEALCTVGVPMGIFLGEKVPGFQILKEVVDSQKGKNHCPE